MSSAFGNFVKHVKVESSNDVDVDIALAKPPGLSEPSLLHADIAVPTHLDFGSMDLSVDGVDVDASSIDMISSEYLGNGMERGIDHSL